VETTAITLLDVLVFVGGLVLGVALGALAKRSIGLVILLLIFIAIAVYYGYLNTASLSFTGIIQAIGEAVWAVIQFIISGLTVLSGNITPESVFSFGTLLGFVTGLAFPKAIRPVRAVGASGGRYVRRVEEEERKRYVREAED
jgi:ABC-type multidrug transport system permease subunit